MFDSIPFRWIASADPAGSIVDRHFESLQLNRYNLSDAIKRGDDQIENIKRFAARWGASGGPSPCCLVIAAPEAFDFAALDSIKDTLPENLYMLIVARAYQRIAHGRIEVIGAHSATLDEYHAKVGGHISRLIRSQPPGSRFRTDTPPYDFESVSYAQPEDWIPQIGVQQEVNIAIGDSTLSFLSLLREDSSALLVIEQSAVSRSPQRPAPIYQRWTWASDFEGGSVIVLNDPLLFKSDSLEAGWWFGTQTQDLVHDCVHVIKRALTKLGLEPCNTVFYGGSAGGFSALHMAAAMKGASAVADIPQLDMRKYHSRVAADSAIETGLKMHSIDEVPDALLYRIDVISRFIKEKNVPHFLLLQNLRDSSHIRSQYADFLSRLTVLQSSNEWARTPYEIHAYSAWSLTRGGHFPLSRGDTMEKINQFAKSKAITPAYDWD